MSPYSTLSLDGQAWIRSQEPNPRMGIRDDVHTVRSLNLIFTASISSAVMSSDPLSIP